MKNLKRGFISALSGWYLWLFPLFALLISAALLKEHFEKQGQDIKIYFDEATGMQTDKTLVKFRGVVIGKVTKITITEDLKDIIAHVTLNKGYERFASEGSKYSLVVPKVNLKGVSGLETLVEGNYINATPANDMSKYADEFKGQIGKDTGESLEDTSYYTLETENVGSINAGDSVSFRGMKIGFVSKVYLSKQSRTVVIQINIQNQFTKLIRTNTHFWNRMAVQAKLSLFKAELKINSLDSFLNGGIALSTPDLVGEKAKAGTNFYLHPSPPKDSESWNPIIE